MTASIPNLPETIANQVIVYPVSQQMITELRAKYADVPQDLSHKDSYEYVRKACSELRSLRTKIEARRKELKADALEYGRKVDAAAKELTEGIVSIEEPLATAKKDYDTAEEIKKREAALAEERRVDGINERIAGIKAAVTAHISSDSATISTVITEIIKLTPAIWADEFSGKAEEAISDTIGKLTELLQMKEHQEQMQEQAEAVRKAEEEKRAKEEEERKAREEEERKQEQALIAAESERLAKERQALEEEKARLKKEQEEKAAAAEKENERLRQELEALKAKQTPPAPSQEVVAAPTPQGESKPVEAERPACETGLQNGVVSADESGTNSVRRTDEYRAAGNAMIKFIGNKTITKSLLDAIINGEIPFISFTNIGA